MLQSGIVLSERYRLEGRLGAGGMGDVWRATDQRLGRTVAVKALLPVLSGDPGFVARFNSEARTMAALHHPGIVNVYDYGESPLPTGETVLYLVMEFVDGQPLSERLLAVGRLTVDETMRIVAEAARALHAAHEAGIVHRDVKPSNLLLAPDGEVRLCDFGVARSQSSTTLTGSHAVLGTARYMAPEQALGRQVTPAADIYALGAVAYHCLAGYPPFEGDSAVQIALRHVQEAPPPLPDDVPQHVRALVERAMAKDPLQRYASAESLANAALGENDDTGTMPLAGAAMVGAAAVPPPDITPTALVLGAEPEPVPAGGSGRGRKVAAGAGALGVAGLIAVLMLLFANDPDGRTNPTSPLDPSKGVSTQDGPDAGPRSPDGDETPGDGTTTGPAPAPTTTGPAPAPTTTGPADPPPTSADPPATEPTDPETEEPPPTAESSP